MDERYISPIEKMAEEKREEKKQRFLESMSRSNVVTASCDSAGISRQAFYRWVADGFITQVELDEARGKFHDLIRGELIKRGFIGIPKMVVSGGKVVTDEDGKPLQQYFPDTRVLLELARKNLPEWSGFKFEDEPEHSEDGIPDRYRLTFDMRKLDKEQFRALKQIAQDIYDSEHGIIDASKVYPATMHEDRYRNN
jgi:hypothetical protein